MKILAVLYSLRNFLAIPFSGMANTMKDLGLYELQAYFLALATLLMILILFVERRIR